MGERETISGSSWPAVAVLAALVGAGVALALAGWKAEAIIGFLTGIATLGGTMLAVLKSNSNQHAKLDKIESAVNGELDRRIEAGAEKAVRRVLDARPGLPPGNPPAPRNRRV